MIIWRQGLLTVILDSVCACLVLVREAAEGFDALRPLRGSLEGRIWLRSTYVANDVHESLPTYPLSLEKKDFQRPNPLVSDIIQNASCVLLLLDRARRIHRSLNTGVDEWMYRLMRRVNAFSPSLLHARSFWSKGPEAIHASDWSSSIESSGQSLLDHLSASSPQSWPWVTRFCDVPGNELFARVPMEFIAEEFNWLGMQYDVDAISLILGSQQGGTRAGRRSDLESVAQHMYGLIHARFIITQKGLLAMREKFVCGAFGTCPRVLCGSQYLLPVGLQDQPGRKDSVKLYCPRCREVYQPGSPLHRALDGAYWGTTIPHLFLLAFPELDPHAASPSGSSSTDGAQHGKSGGPCCTDHACGSGPRYQPRVFGFRVKNSRQY